MYVSSTLAQAVKDEITTARWHPVFLEHLQIQKHNDGLGRRCIHRKTASTVLTKSKLLCIAGSRQRICCRSISWTHAEDSFPHKKSNNPNRVQSLLTCPILD